ncbi:MAG: hypothetical protein U0869_05680 [Chloroflexota bacterium]
MTRRVTRLLGVTALLLALAAPAAMAKEIGSGGGTVTPPPVTTAAPCAAVADVLAQSKKGSGETIGINVDFSVVSCSSAAETLTYEAVMVGTTDGLLVRTLPATSTGSLGAGKKLVTSWDVPNLPWHTGMTVTITVRNAGLGERPRDPGRVHGHAPPQGLTPEPPSTRTGPASPVRHSIASGRARRTPTPTPAPRSGSGRR